MRRRKTPALMVVLGCAWGSHAVGLVAADSISRSVQPFLQKHRVECHDTETKKGQLDLTVLSSGLTNRESFATWVKVHDRVRAGEMAPEKKPRPAARELDKVICSMCRG